MERVGAEELLRLTPRVRGLVEAGRVFTVQDVEGQNLLGRISLEHGRLHLYSLQATLPPPNGLPVQMSSVVPPGPPCEVFLDLAWPGSAVRRVVLSLPEDTPSGRQFVMLCSGQCGPSYANTRLIRVWDAGLPGEWVDGGDYETNTGRGGAGLLPFLDHSHYSESGKAGAVWGPFPGCFPGQDAQFSITTQDCRPGYKGYRGVFGKVVRGLEVLQEAARHRPITEVIVVQCGILVTPPH